MIFKIYKVPMCTVKPAHYDSPYIEVYLLQSAYEFPRACTPLQYWSHHARCMTEYVNAWIGPTPLVGYVSNLKVRAHQHFRSLQTPCMSQNGRGLIQQLHPSPIVLLRTMP